MLRTPKLTPRTPMRRGTRRRVVLLVSTFVGLLTAILALYHVTLKPPFLHSRELQIGAAQTVVMINAKGTDITALAPGVDALDGLTSQANLVAEVMTTDPVLQRIGHLIGVPASQIEADAPVTAAVPRTIIEPDSGANAMALISAPDHYKLQIQVDPVSPIMHIYTQAPSAAAALSFATATVRALREYLNQLSGSRGVASPNRILIDQLGPPWGGVANSNAVKELGLLAFITGFAISLILITVGSRIRQGWRLASGGAEALS
jgi:hypothetical protein